MNAVIIAVLTDQTKRTPESIKATLIEQVCVGIPWWSRLAKT